MAYRAGATLQDMEMVQFHPTTLYVAGSSRALITEAVRGEGAYLVDRNGYRFMNDYHPDGELAPRDVVSRAIVEQIRKTHFTHVFLDVRHLPTERVPRALPAARASSCDQFEIDPSKDLIPIHPAAHYMIGGVDADEHRPDELARAVRRRRSELLRAARRQSAGEQFAAGRARVRRLRRRATRREARRKIGIKFPLKLEHKVAAVDQDRARRRRREELAAQRDVAKRRHRAHRRAADRDARDHRVLEPLRDGQDVSTRRHSAAGRGGGVGTAEHADRLLPDRDRPRIARTESRGAHYRLDYPAARRRALATASALATADGDPRAGPVDVRTSVVRDDRRRSASA